MINWWGKEMGVGNKQGQECADRAVASPSPCLLVSLSPCLSLFTRVVAFGLLLLAVGGCQQKMAKQPAYRPLEPSDFFADGRSARPPMPGTVAWDFNPQEKHFGDNQFLTGKKVNR